MKNYKHTLPIVFILSIIFLLGAFVETKTANNNILSKSVPPDTIHLFNEDNLEGLELVMNKKFSGSVHNLYSIQNGGLFFDTKETGYLKTKEEYENYTLHVEWKWPEGSENSNSGILIHTQAPDSVWPKCIQVQLKIDRAGDLIAMNGAMCKETTDKPRNTADRLSESSEKPINQWNECEIICRGDSMAVFVNGVLQNKATGCLVKSGTIGLQLEGKPIGFRKIYLLKQ